MSPIPERAKTSRSWEERVKVDLVRAKSRARELAAQVAARDVLLSEMRNQLIAARARDRLRRAEYFHDYIGVERVLGVDGRIDWRRFDLLVDDLVRRYPEFKAVTDESPSML
jgi:hypothetical protein